MANVSIGLEIGCLKKSEIRWAAAKAVVHKYVSVGAVAFPTVGSLGGFLLLVHNLWLEGVWACNVVAYCYHNARESLVVFSIVQIVASVVTLHNVAIKSGVVALSLFK